MKPFRTLASLAAAIAATASLGLGGCLQTEDRTTLLADGSGTMSQTITMDLAKLKELEELAKAFGGGAPGTGAGEGGMDLGKMLDDMMSEKSLREQLKDSPGVEVKKLTSEVKEGRRVTNVDLAFADFSSLGKGGFQTTGVELKKNDDGTWTLTFDGFAASQGLMGGGGGAGAPGAAGGLPPGMDMSAMMGMFEPYFGSLSVQRRLTVPGKVVATNGTASEDGTSVDWKVTWKDLVAGTTAPAKDAKAPGHMTVTFRGEGLTLKPFAYRPDAKEIQKRAEKAARTAAPEAPKPEPAPTTPSEK